MTEPPCGSRKGKNTKDHLWNHFLSSSAAASYRRIFSAIRATENNIIYQTASGNKKKDFHSHIFYASFNERAVNPLPLGMGIYGATGKAIGQCSKIKALNFYSKI